MNKYTPGPWTTTLSVVGTTRGTICTMCRPCDRTGRGIPSDEQDANARLIAAAPDLLAACREALDVSDHMADGDECYSVGDWDTLATALRAAIDKAQVDRCGAPS